MSRLGKKEISIPKGVSAGIDNGTFSVKGPKGTLTRQFLPDITINISSSAITLAPTHANVFTRSLWGTYSSHIRNMIKGVTEGFNKKLLVEGTGYRWELSGDKLKLSLGLSHPVVMNVPEGITVKPEKGELNINGLDKELVGGFAARVRAKKKPEPYKGKGIRYSDEIIERKQGKRSTA